jgi:4-oxalocrotonate tautomerase
MNGPAESGETTFVAHPRAFHPTFAVLHSTTAAEGVFPSAQKREMIKKVTDVMISVEGEAMRGVTWVKVDEIESGDWAVGGQMPDDGRDQGPSG